MSQCVRWDIAPPCSYKPCPSLSTRFKAAGRQYTFLLAVRVKVVRKHPVLFVLVVKIDSPWPEDMMLRSPFRQGDEYFQGGERSPRHPSILDTNSPYGNRDRESSSCSWPPRTKALWCYKSSMGSA